MESEKVTTAVAALSETASSALSGLSWFGSKVATAIAAKVTPSAAPAPPTDLQPSFTARGPLGGIAEVDEEEVAFGSGAAPSASSSVGFHQHQWAPQSTPSVSRPPAEAGSGRSSGGGGGGSGGGGSMGPTDSLIDLSSDEGSLTHHGKGAGGLAEGAQSISLPQSAEIKDPFT